MIREVAKTCHGSSKFVTDPLRAGFVEASTEESGNWMKTEEGGPFPNLSVTEANDLLEMFKKATCGLVDFIDVAELRSKLATALDQKSLLLAQERIIPYLVMAIGAQSSQRLCHHAESLFCRGRYLATRYLMDDASILTVQAYVLITIYLLSASRRNTASMHLRFAIGSMYALGIHRKAVAVRFSKKESLLREKLWTSVRILDLFLSASLGRPVATTETRNTQLQDEYSAWNELCMIFENVLTQVYDQRSITAEVVDKIGQHQREWADNHTKVETRHMTPNSPDQRGSDVPNIGTLHIKLIYYWTIMLLTRPFIIERVVAHVNQTLNRSEAQCEGLRPCSLPDLSKTLVYACVNSAIKTIKLLEPLISCTNLPGRLPLLINAAFHSALVVGFAHFGDLYLVFPLAKYLHVAHSILLKFEDDPVASRNATIIQYLVEVCQLHIEKRHVASMDIECEAIGKLFGHIDSEPRASVGISKETQKLAQNTMDETEPYNPPLTNLHTSPGDLPQGEMHETLMSGTAGEASSIYAGSIVSQSPSQLIPGLEPFAPIPTVLDSSLLGNPQLFWLDFDNDISSLFTIIGPPQVE